MFLFVGSFVHLRIRSYVHSFVRAFLRSFGFSFDWVFVGSRFCAIEPSFLHASAHSYNRTFLVKPTAPLQPRTHIPKLQLPNSFIGVPHLNPLFIYLYPPSKSAQQLNKVHAAFYDGYTFLFLKQKEGLFLH